MFCWIRTVRKGERAWKSNAAARSHVVRDRTRALPARYGSTPCSEQIERQLATGLIGPMNVTRAVLPVMRKQRSGHIIQTDMGITARHHADEDTPVVLIEEPGGRSTTAWHGRYKADRSLRAEFLSLCQQA